MTELQAIQLIYELNEKYLKSKAFVHLNSFWTEVNKFETSDDIIRGLLDLLIEHVDYEKMTQAEQQQLRVTRAMYDPKNQFRIKPNHIRSAIMLLVTNLHNSNLKELFKEYV